MALDNLSGKLVGNYLLIGLIGSGATSHVYLAEHQALKRRMAVKILSPSLTFTPDKATKLLSEAVALAKVDHPNVARVYDCNTAEGITYLALEYVEGHSLDQLIKLSGIFPPDQLQELAKQLLEGLNAIHSAGLLHLDIKPGNILATKDHAYKYADFGLSKNIPSLEQPITNKFLGTAEYAAPELAVGRPPDIRSDLYALGATLYKAATGRVPFSGDNVTDVLKKQLYEPLIPPSVYNPAIPTHIDQFIVKLMSKERDQRPSSCGEAMQLFSPPVRRSPVTRRSVRGKRFIILGSRRSSSTTWLIAGLCAAALVSIVLLAVNRGISRKVRPNGEPVTVPPPTVPNPNDSPSTATPDVPVKIYRLPGPTASVLLLRQGTYLPGLISKDDDHYSVQTDDKTITVYARDVVSWFKTSHEMAAEAKLAAADAQFLYDKSRLASKMGDENSLLNQALVKAKAAIEDYTLTRNYFASDADRWIDERITKMGELIILARQKELSTRVSIPPNPKPPIEPSRKPNTGEEPQIPRDAISAIKGYLVAPDIRLEPGPRGVNREKILSLTSEDLSFYEYAFALFLSRSEYDWGLRCDELTLTSANINYKDTPGRITRKSAINTEFEFSQGGVISISQSPNAVRFTPPGGESQAAESFSINENVKTKQLDELQYYFNAVIHATDRNDKARHNSLAQQIERSILRLKKDEPSLYPAALHLFLVMHLNVLQAGAFWKSDKASLEAICTSVGYMKSDSLEIWGGRLGIEVAQYHDNISKGLTTGATPAKAIPCSVHSSGLAHGYARIQNALKTGQYKDFIAAQSALDNASTASINRTFRDHFAALATSVRRATPCKSCGGKYTQGIVCRDCKGTARRDYYCSPCSGHGYVMVLSAGTLVSQRCNACDGIGVFKNQPCKTCGGTGTLDCKDCRGPMRAPLMTDITDILECPMCGGHGYLFNNPIIDCYDCFGLGKCLTPRVDPAKVVCRPLREKDYVQLTRLKK